MAEPLQFQLSLTGTFAQSLAADNKGLTEFQAKAKATGSLVDFLDKQFDKFGSQGREGIQRFLTFDIVSAARAAYDAIARIGSAFAGIGKDIAHTIGDFQDLQLAMRLNLGDEGARMLQGIADSFGSSRFDDDLVNKALIPFAEMGMRDEVLLDRVATAAGDLSARLNTGDQGFLDYTDAFRKIALKGEVDAKALKALQIGEADYYKNLGGFLRVSAKQAEALAKQGKVDSEVLIATALDEVAKREGGMLGSGTNAGGKTLGGTLARLGNLSGNIFKQLSDSEGAKALQKMLEDILDFGQGDGGKGIVKFLDRTIVGALKLADTVGSFFGGFSSFGRAAAAVFDGLLDGANSLARSFAYIADESEGSGNVIVTIGETIGSVFRGAGFVIGSVAAALFDFNRALNAEFAAIGEFFSGLWQSYMEYASSIVETFRTLGGDLLDGFVDGILERWEGAKDRVRGLWTSVTDEAKAALGIQSPSRVFMEIGGYTAEGMALGLEGGRDRIASAAEQSLADTVFGGLTRLQSGAPASASSGGVSGGITVVLQYYAAEGRSSQEDARELVGDFRDELERFFVEGT